MTFVGITTTPRRLDIVTDSLTARPGHRRQWTMSNGKAVALPTVRGAVVSTGSTPAGQAWTQQATTAALTAASIEDLVDAADPAGCYPADSDMPTALYLAGWSPRRRRFAAWAWATWTDWEPVEVTGNHYSQQAMGWTATDDLAQRLDEHKRRGGHDAVADRKLRSRGRRPAPVSADDWIELVTTAQVTPTYRLGRMDLYPIIGGTLRRLTIDHTITEQTVAVLDRPGKLSHGLTTALRSTLHPLGQRAPCPCGSRLAKIDCHIDHLYGDRDCMCRSGRPFEECCRLGNDPDETDLHDGIILTTTTGTELHAWDTPAAETRRCPSCSGHDVDEISVHDTAWMGIARCRGCPHLWAPPVLASDLTQPQAAP